MLHTVNKSPAEKFSLQSCLRVAKAGSDILLIEDGVYAAVRNAQHANLIENSLHQHQFYVLNADLECRGIDRSEVIEGIEMVDYAGFVGLAVRNHTVHSWL